MGSRATLWRKRKRSLQECKCHHHSSVSLESQGRCTCEYHILASQDTVEQTTCDCRYHCQETIENYDSSSSDSNNVMPTDGSSFNDEATYCDCPYHNEEHASSSENDERPPPSQLSGSRLNGSNYSSNGSCPTDVLQASINAELTDGVTSSSHKLQECNALARELDDGSQEFDDQSCHKTSEEDQIQLPDKTLNAEDIMHCVQPHSLHYDPNGSSGSDNEGEGNFDLNRAPHNPQYNQGHNNENEVLGSDIGAGGSSNDVSDDLNNDEPHGPRYPENPDDPDSSDDDEDEEDSDIGAGGSSTDASDDLNNDEPHGPRYPENPDDPESSGDDEDEEDSYNESDEEFDETGGFTLEKEELNRLLHMVPGCTVREALAMVMAVVLKHNLNYLTTTKIFLVINAVLGDNVLPTTVKQLWRAIRKGDAGIQKHAYCSMCNRHLGIFGRLARIVQCACGFTTPRQKVKYFIIFSVQKQLQKLLKDPCFREWMQYKHRREKKVPGALEDILDGQAYHELPLSPNDFTYAFNMDGFKISKSSKTEAWPIFLRLNELPLNLRQKYVLLAGLWVDTEHLNFNLFMKRFVIQANALSANGILWKPDGVNEVVSKFFPTVCCADAKGRAGILNMTECSGSYSCHFCTHIGIKLDGAMKFPLPGTRITRIRRRRGVEYEEHSVIPVPVPRTHESITNAMEEAGRTGQRIEGLIGMSQVMLLDHFDMGSGFSVDDLHPIFKGVTEFHTQLLIEGFENAYPSLTKQQITRINHRLKKIKTPTHIARKPRPLTLIAKWKASEWRNWLLYYAIPCLRGIIPDRHLRHLGLLSRAVFKLMRDIVTEEDLEDADECLQRYVETFQRFYSPDNMRFNVHMLQHLVAAVRNWGPLWAHSTFQFESWNHRLAKTVTSSRCPASQMAMRYAMHFMVQTIDSDQTISDEVKNIVKLIRDGDSLPNARRVSGAVVFGKSHERPPTDEERQLLEEEGFQCEFMDEYKQVKVCGVEVRSSKFPVEGQSMNNIVYTATDEFFSVESIVVLGNINNPTCGLFVKKFDVGEPLLNVPHIVPVENHFTRAFIVVSSVTNLVLKVPFTNELYYIMPMPNNNEID